MPNILLSTFLYLMCGLVFSTALNAKPYVPALLEPWESWVMYEHKDVDCPHSYDAQNKRYCRWPISLSIDIQRHKAAFQQRWRIYNEGWLTLPGDHQYWPTNVTLSEKVVSGKLVSDKPVAVVKHKNKPSIFVPAGEYVVNGELLWKQRPESIAVPKDTGIVTVILDGKPLSSINRDKKGRLWFANAKQESNAVGQNNSVTTRVYRKIIDGVPVKLETRLEMEVAGDSRELTLGKLQLSGYETIRFDSQLPARIETDGSLRVQARPGRWNFTLLSRQVSEVPDIASVRMGSDWPDQEIWVFQANRTFRSVKILGVPTVDPEQTGLPEGWRQLPAYVLSDNQVLTIKEQVRGDSSPDDNRLLLKRNLWLDFDGKGYTVKDEISGNISRIGRLATDDAFSLGRVSVNGNPTVVTQMDDGQEGIEVRPGEITLDAVGRMDRNASAISAVSWSESMQSLSMELQLPPGWMLFAASGADQVHNSWLSSWSLWHVFILLITTVSTFRLFGFKWALLVGVALLSVHDVDGAPWSVAWLILLALFSLLNVVPEGRWRTLTCSAYRVLLLGLVISLIPFAVSQVRQGIYPQLEKPYKQVSSENQADYSRHEPALEGMQQEFDDEISSLASVEQAPRRKMKFQSSRSDYQRYDVSTKIQTGPGVPQWTWNRSQLNWSGPVTPSQPVELWLISPTVNSVLSFVRVLLVGLLLVLFVIKLGFGVGKSLPLNLRGGANAAVMLSAIILTFPLLYSTQAVADVPTQEMLDTLEKRLLTPSECLPHCAAISQGVVAVDQEFVVLDLMIDAAEAVVVPLPIDTNSWKPNSILLNNENISVSSQQGRKYIMLLEKGRNRVEVRGRHHQIEQLNFAFKLEPHNIKVIAKGWEVTGYVNDQVSGGNVQFKRTVLSEKGGKSEKREQLLAEPVPVFVEVIRTLRLGFEWRMTTQVRRISPMQGAISLAVPLVDNESLTADFPVENGNVLISMKASQQTLQWDSIITLSPGNQQNGIVFNASEGSWVERWNVVPSQRWHVEHKGISPIKQNGVNQLSWWPIMGDRVELAITKPDAVAGNTLTLQSVNLLYEPGARATTSTLSLTMRSSFAGEYLLELPDNADVESVVVDGEGQVRAEDSGRVTLPVKPGEHTAQVRWSTNDGARYKIVTPALDLGQRASNVSIRVDMPRDRWTLFVGGPAMGPALLFWGVALLIVAIGLVLGKMQWSILKPYEWVLLGLGVATTYVPMLLLIVGWFYVMHWRKEWASTGMASTSAALTPRKQMAIQWSVGLLTFGMLVSLLASVASSLVFGNPDMQIAGNGSSAYWLNWYQDRTGGVMPSGWVISVPMGAYRLAMLAWSLWLAFALVRWLKWGWQCFTVPMLESEKVSDVDEG